MDGFDRVIELFPEHAEIIIAFAAFDEHPFLILDDNANVIGCNNKTYAALGYGSFDEFINAFTTFSDLALLQEGCVDAKADNWIMKLEESKRNCIALKTKSGGVFRSMMKLQSFAIQDVILHLCLLDQQGFHDKTQQDKECYESFKKHFLDNISHQFRTPMNSISGFAELLEKTSLDRAQKEYLYNITTSAHEMMENIDNLLTMMQTGDEYASARDISFSPLKEFGRLADEYNILAHHQGIQIFFIVDPQLPAKMSGDYDKIKRVLSNLLSNAIKFSKPKNAKIVVEIRSKTDRNSVFVEYVVSDNGIGIGLDKLRKILKPYTSMMEMNDFQDNEVGIGLTLSHKLLALMGSRLRVKSVLNKGSRFSFEIMHDIVERSQYTIVAGSKVALLAEASNTSVWLKQLKFYLEKFQVEYIEVNSFANQELSNVDALFVFTDYTSEQKAKALKSHYPGLQIVQVCSRVDPEHLHLIRSKLDVCIVRPLMPDKVYDALKTIWDKTADDNKQTVLKTIDKQFDGAKILIAEDNEINLKLLKTILRTKHYHLTSAVNGQIAVDLFLKEDFDLVLMDIDMPIMDGITATRLIKEYDKKRGVFTPVIALTAHALSGDREKILNAGLDAHLAKPIDREFLLQVIESYLNQKISSNNDTNNFV